MGKRDCRKNTPTTRSEIFQIRITILKKFCGVLRRQFTHINYLTHIDKFKPIQKLHEGSDTIDRIGHFVTILRSRECLSTVL